MSGAGIACCRICGHHLESDWGYMDHYLVEERTECPGCGLYVYEFSYGAERDLIGVIETTWGPNPPAARPGDWRKQEEEAKFIHRSADAQALLRAMRDQPAAETPRLVFADWLDDHDCPLSAAYLRGV